MFDLAATLNACRSIVGDYVTRERADIRANALRAAYPLATVRVLIIDNHYLVTMEV